jgi:four helix bundle protein
MGVYRFEDLRVWQAAKQQSDRVGALLLRPAFRDDRQLSEHMNGAALSVMFNISEGFLRRRDKETLQFLRYAFASNGELKSAYYAAEGRQLLPADETADLIRLNESIAKMLRRWQATLEPSDRSRPKDRGRTKDQGRTRTIGLSPGTWVTLQSNDMGNTIRHRPGGLHALEVPRCRGARRRPWSNAWNSFASTKAGCSR